MGSRPGRWVWLASSLLACTNEPVPPPGDKPPIECALGGDFLMGVPQVDLGGCAVIPVERELSIEPTAPGAFDVVWAGVRLSGESSDDCMLTTDAKRQLVDGHDTSIDAVLIEVHGDYVDATFAIQVFDAGAECDAVFTMAGVRAPEAEGNPTGGSCESGGDCAFGLCAFGGVSACAFDLCIFERDQAGAETLYCSEPCQEGSCPAGYACEDVSAVSYDTAVGTACVAIHPVCGNQVIEGDEACDDGNLGSGDGCNAECTSNETCGNLFVDPDEDCDDGALVPADGCSPLCFFEECGNHIVDPGETCDDGGELSGDGCSGTCKLEDCGDTFVDVGEACDDGNLSSTDGCDGECRLLAEDGTTRVDAAWARALPGGESPRLDEHHAVATPTHLVFAWTEVYDSGPFGGTHETFVGRRDLADDRIVGPVRLAGLQGWELSGLVRHEDGTLYLLARSGTSLSLSSSTNAGASFSAPVELTVPDLPAGGSAGAFAQLHADGDVLYLLLGKNVASSGPSNRNLYFSRSLDGGVTWSSAVRLSETSDTSGWASRPLLHAAGGGELTIVWGDGELGAGQVFAARSLDQGDGWLRLAEPMGAHAAGRTERTQAALTSGEGMVQLSFAGPDGWLLFGWTLDVTQWQESQILPATALGDALGPIAMATGNGGVVHLALQAGSHTFYVRADEAGPLEAPRRVAPAPAGTAFEEISALALAVDLESGAAGSDDVVLALVADVAAGEAAQRSVHALRSDDGGDNFGEATSEVTAPAAGGSQLAPAFTVVRLGFAASAFVAVAGRLWLVDLFDLPLLPPAEPFSGTAGADCVEALDVGGWCTPSTLLGPGPRFDAVAAAAGEEVIVFGGSDGFLALSSGAIYDAADDTWRAMADARPAGLSGRSAHTAVWTGSALLVWGGHNGVSVLGDGGLYDPVLDTWTKVSAIDAPAPRSSHSAVWTGTELVVWGGRGVDGVFADGGIYDPALDTWTAIEDSGYDGVAEHTAVWTGAEMVVFGGFDAAGAATTQGLRFDLDGDSVVPLPGSGAPASRGGHAAVFVPEGGVGEGRMFVFGGRDDQGAKGGGGVYLMPQDDWVGLEGSGAPSSRYGFVSALTPGLDWYIWGGTNDRTGAVYDSGLDAWSSLSVHRAPEPRRGAAGVWVEAGGVGRLLVIGGRDGGGVALGDVGMFVP